jgi:sterol desaturase/sphingolipid hydroxylase (fatty acid hydroxylase superfamily)
VNELVDRLFQATPVLLIGLNPTLTLASAPILTLYAIGLHANLNWDYGPLRGWLASPVFHRWHHSNSQEAINKNFAGLLPVWDILFGTYYMPKGLTPQTFGIHEPMPAGFLSQLRFPFSKRSEDAPKRVS